MLKVCKRSKDGNGYTWTMKEEFAAIVRHYENIVELTEEEIKDRKIEANGEPGDTDEGDWWPETPTK